MTDKPSVLRVAGEPVAWQGKCSLKGHYCLQRSELGLVSTEGLYTEAQLLAMYAAGAEDMRERAASEAGRMMMYPGGRCEAPAHDNVWAAAKAIRALPITTSTEGGQGE